MTNEGANVQLSIHKLMPNKKAKCRKSLTRSTQNSTSQVRHESGLTAELHERENVQD